MHVRTVALDSTVIFEVYFRGRLHFILLSRQEPILHPELLYWAQNSSLYLNSEPAAVDGSFAELHSVLQVSCQVTCLYNVVQA